MSRIFSRTMLGMSAYASVVTSPATCTWPVVINDSTATRLRGSLASKASRIESLIASQILSGCPSVTDSEVNNLRDSDTLLPTIGWLMTQDRLPVRCGHTSQSATKT